MKLCERYRQVQKKLGHEEQKGEEKRRNAEAYLFLSSSYPPITKWKQQQQQKSKNKQIMHFSCEKFVYTILRRTREEGREETKNKKKNEEKKNKNKNKNKKEKENEKKEKKKKKKKKKKNEKGEE
ncbi:hypothetical protein RB195_015891 [Necator americanus]|uniref:Uncharacterized protein n=1 Tax=Necator americanus TaxID=51031 RepID=A0ABR1E728_NECAM